PDRLKGDAIPLGARVIAVADALDAMISDRPHRAPLTVEAALDQLREGAGRQFDRACVDAFIEVLAETPQPAVSSA
ncbi:MAG: HD domain-containing phosphohydrolase, partial [Planctomycetota bacterium]